MKFSEKRIKELLIKFENTSDKKTFCNENKLSDNDFNYLKSLYEDIKKKKTIISNEGVADKFVEKDPRLFNVPRDFEKFEKEYNVTDGEIFYRKDNWKLIKNPKTLQGFGPYVRGVVTISGDLYLEQHSDGTIHNDIIDVLVKEQIIPDVSRKWGSMLPEQSKFVTVQRFKNENLIAIGESNRILYDINDWKKYQPKYEEVFERLKMRSPSINFTTKLIGSKGFVINKGDNFLIKPESD